MRKFLKVDKNAKNVRKCLVAVEFEPGPPLFEHRLLRLTTTLKSDRTLINFSEKLL